MICWSAKFVKMAKMVPSHEGLKIAETDTDKQKQSHEFINFKKSIKLHLLSKPHVLNILDDLQQFSQREQIKSKFMTSPLRMFGG